MFEKKYHLYLEQDEYDCVIRCLIDLKNRLLRQGCYMRNFGVRLDSEKYSYLMRLNPHKGEYNLYCYCYIKEWLDKRLDNATKGIRFIDSNYNEKFRIPDGGKILMHYCDGASKEMTCRYIDDYHAEIGSNLYHICEFAELCERNGHSVEPAIHEPKKERKSKPKER